MVAGAGKGVMATKLDEGDSLLGFALLGVREGIEVETNKGRVEAIRLKKFPVTSRGGKGRELIRTGYLSRMVPLVTEVRLKAEDEASPEEGAPKPAGRRKRPES